MNYDLSAQHEKHKALSAVSNQGAPESVRILSPGTTKPDKQSPIKRHLTMIIIIALAVFVVSGIVAIQIFKGTTQEFKSKISFVLYYPIKVVDVSEMPASLSIVPVNEHSTFLTKADTSLVRFADDAGSGRLLGISLKQNLTSPWIIDADPKASVGIANDSIFVEDPQQKQAVQVNELSGRTNPVKLSESLTKDFKPASSIAPQRQTKTPDGCENEKGFKPIAALDYKDARICSDGINLWETNKGKQKWTLQFTEGIRALNQLDSPEPLWRMDGDLLVLADSDGIHSVNLALGKPQWQFREAVKSWRIDNMMMYAQTADGKFLKIFDLDKSHYPEKFDEYVIPDQRPLHAITPLADQGRKDAEEAFNRISGLTFEWTQGNANWSLDIGDEGRLVGLYRATNEKGKEYTHQKFTGKLKFLEKKNDHILKMRLTSVKLYDEPGKKVLPDGRTDISVADVFGVVLNGDYEIYFPGTDSDETLGRVMRFPATNADGDAITKQLSDLGSGVYGISVVRPDGKVDFAPGRKHDY